MLTKLSSFFNRMKIVEEALEWGEVEVEVEVEVRRRGGGRRGEKGGEEGGEVRRR